MWNTPISRTVPFRPCDVARVRVEARQAEADGLHAGHALLLPVLFLAATLAFASPLQVLLFQERAQGLVLDLAVPAVLVLSLSLLAIPALRTSPLKSKEDV
jgi:hypothetical protein